MGLIQFLEALQPNLGDHTSLVEGLDNQPAHETAQNGSADEGCDDELLLLDKYSANRIKM